MKTFPLRPALLPLLLALAGCPDSAGDPPPDPTVPPGCEAACHRANPFRCLTDPNSGACVECTSDAHCQQNPWAMGDRCDSASKTCTCSGDAGCAAKKQGSRCDPLYGTCGCASDAHCQAPLRCVGQLFGQTVCAAPCTADRDCTSSERPHCDVDKGSCRACTSDDQCQNPLTPRCSTTLGRCVSCLNNEDCRVPGLPYCDPQSGACGECTSDAHCEAARKSGTTRGNVCLDTQQGKACRCRTSADCQGNASGPTCNIKEQMCSCTGKAQCSLPPLTKCGPPSVGVGYAACASGCTTDKQCGTGLSCLPGGTCGECQKDADCPSTTIAQRPHCLAAQARCVACLSDSHCSSTPDKPRCDAASGSCVECSSDADCAADPDGPRCNRGVCGCDADSQCKAQTWGPRCLPLPPGTPGGKRCGCASKSDCAASKSGPTCDPLFGKCTCTSAGECSGETLCLHPYLKAPYRHCRPPCTKDAQCAGGTAAAHCNPESGACVECISSAHCAGTPRPHCDTSKNACFLCKTDDQCKESPLGPRCVSGTCQCVDSGDCKGSQMFGPVCVSGILGKNCKCDGNADCKGSVWGTTCAFPQRICSCQSDADCSSAGQPICSLTGGGVTQCRPNCAGNPLVCDAELVCVAKDGRCGRCQSDADCTQATRPRCDLTKYDCVACLQNKDCAANRWSKICQGATCVECTANSDCTTASLGNRCILPLQICVCQQDGDCAGNHNGSLCDPTYQVCGCSKDTHCPTGRRCTGSTAWGHAICQ